MLIRAPSAGRVLREKVEKHQPSNEVLRLFESDANGSNPEPAMFVEDVRLITTFCEVENGYCRTS
jgi:hypothetical protein